MSNSVDNRIVDMQFNNRQFESGIADSLKSIDKLKSGLDFDGSVKSLENLGKAGKNFSLAGITEGVEMVAQKFSAMEAIALGALMRIGSKIADIGMRMIKDFTVAPITQGFGEYELKMNSIQTMMLGSGESLDVVNGKLEELNTYADKTIYSFSDMTANIGKFVNAGVSLDKSVAAIQGISNVAAVSGANANEASRAMYNFSQALSKGFVQLIDWKSIENANMATVEFKQQLIESAVAAGTLTKKGDEYRTSTGTMITATKDFNDSLKDQWMTSEVLTETLGRYADETTEIGAKAFKAAQEVKTFSQLIDTIKESIGSGWAQTWEIVFGNFDEAKELLSGINSVVDDFVGRMTKARNDVLQGWKDAGGRDALIEGFAAAFENLGKILAPIGEAFRNVFPPITGETLLRITEAFRDLMVNFEIGETTSNNLRRAFEGLFSFVKLLAQAFGFLFRVAGAIIKTLAPVGSFLLGLAAELGDFITSLSNAASEGEVFVKALDWVRAFLQKISDGVAIAVDKIKEKFEQFKNIDLGPLTTFMDTVEIRFRPFTFIASVFATALEAIAKVFQWAAPIFVKLGGIIGGALGSFLDKVKTLVMAGDFEGLLDLVNTVLLGGIMVGVKKFTNSFANIAKSASSITGGFVQILDGVRGALEAYQTKLKAQALLTIAIAIGILAASLFVLAMIPSEQMTSALAGITVLFIELAAIMVVLSKSMGTVKLGAAAAQMVAMSVAILILSAALKNLASLDWNDLMKGIVGIGALAAILVLSAEILSHGAPKMIKGSVGMIAFATAILILSKSVEKLAGLSWEEMIRGLVGVAAIFGAIAGFMHIMPDQKRMITTGIGMIALGAAMLIFATAVERMGQMEWEEIGKGLATMGGALLIIAGALNLMPKGMINKSVALIALGAALLIIGSAVEKMGDMEWIEIARGLTALAGAMLIIAGALNLMPKGMINKAAGLIGIAAALTIMAAALKMMGSMTWEQLAIGLIALAGGLAAMAGAANLMTKALPGAAAILILSPALLLLAAALKILGSMNLQEIGLALLSLVGVFAVLGVAALVLGPVVPIILALSVAVALLGVGVTAMGVGLIAFAAGLSALSLGATAAAAAIVVIGSAILSLIPLLFEQLGEGIMALARAVIMGAPLLGEAFVTLIVTAMESLKVAVPAIVDAVFVLLLGILTAIDENLPDIVDKLFSIVTGFLEKVAENLPRLIKAGAELLGAFLKGIFEAMGGYEPENLFQLLSSITLLVAAFAILAASKKLAKDAIIATGAMVIVMGLITALFVVIASLDIDSVLEISLSLSAVLLAISAALVILSFIPIPAALTAVASLGIFVAGLAVILAALGGLAQIPGLEWLLGEGSRMLSLIGEAIGGFVGSIVGGFLGGVAASFPKIGSDLSEFMKNVTPFIEGTKNIDASAMNGVKALAETVLILTAAAILEGLTSWLTGGSSMVDFGKEISEFAPYFVDYYNTIKGVDGSVVEASANAAKALGEFASSLPKEGGLLAKITGENSITKFAEELVLFGPSLMTYADSVKGLDGEVVVNSANAAKALAEMAHGLPNQGGVVSWFTGDNTLSVFAEELAAFGPSLMEYATTVTGLDGDVVVASANAAKALSELAHGLPNQGGVVSWFTGDNTLSVFGAELAAFGPYLASYADSVAHVTPSVVTASANAAKALAELADNIPNTGGLKALFTGDNNIADFGLDLSWFGYYFGLYYDYVKNISLSQVMDVISSVNALVEMAKGAKDTKTEGLTAFIEGLTSLGDMGITGFLSAFENAGARAQTAVSTFITSVATAVSSGQVPVITQMTQIATTMVSSFITTLTSKKQSIVNATTLISDNAIAAIRLKQTSWISTATYLVEGLILGIQQKAPDAVLASVNLATSMLTGINKTLGVSSPAKALIIVGQFVVAGLAKGITDSLPVIDKSAGQLGSSLVNSFKTFFEIASPSKLMKTEIGYRLVEGIAEGIKENMTAEEAARQKAQNIFGAFKDELDKQQLTMTTYGLEFQLWETVYGATATDAEKQAKQLELSSAEAVIQQERVNIAMGEWQQMAEEFGAGDPKTQEAYNRFLQEQINFNKTLNDIEAQQIAIQGSINDRRAEQADAMVRYANIMAESAEGLRQQGFSEEEIESWAREKAGYDPAALVPSVSQNAARQVVQDSMATVATEYSTQTEALTGELRPMFTTSGEEYATAIGTGFVSKFEEVTTIMLQAVNIMGDAMFATLTNISASIKANIDALGFEVESRVNAIIDMYNKIPMGPRYDRVSYLDSLASNRTAQAINSATADRLTSAIVDTLPSPDRGSGGESGGKGDTYNFEQNNYSPKALSQTEIYRKTKNQFAQLKEALT